ncbi:MAG: polysaccharide biosynthesis/export family protein [Opitutales bacterium]|jgi:polysaccharide export outer membrane protein
MKWTYLFAAAFISVCAPNAQAQNPTEPSTKVKASENYKIGPLDVIHFRIIGEPETETEVRVANDSSVTLPYIGTVRLKDMTVAQAREFLFAQYSKDFYVNPQVDIAIVAYKQRRVNVQGMVNKQGFVLFPPEEKMTLLGAIALAGGWGDNRLAQRSAVKLVRTDEKGETQTYVIDANTLGQDDWPLIDGDLIVVPERKW